jgi:hypothetical protein
MTGHGLDAVPHGVPLPEVRTARGWRRVRFWCIEHLARGDIVVMNTDMITPLGWAFYKRAVDAGALVKNNLFVLGPRFYTEIPTTKVLYRVPVDGVEE